MKYSIVERQEKIDEILYPEISTFLMLIKDQDRVTARDLLFLNFSIRRSELYTFTSFKIVDHRMQFFHGLLVYVQHVRRAAVLALSTAAHNKPNLVKCLLPELLPLLYDQTVIKVSAPANIDLHTVDSIPSKCKRCIPVDHEFFVL